LATTGCGDRRYVELPSGYHDSDAIRTANELLDELEARSDWSTNFGHRTTYLPEEEAQIVAKELQTRYPLKSIRESLHFQPEHPAPIARVETGSGREYEDGFFSQRSRALAELHSEEVLRFINRNGQGVSRSPMPAPSDLRLWDTYANRIETTSFVAKILGECIVTLHDSI